MWSQERFGERAAARYRELLKQALRDIAFRSGALWIKERLDLARGVRTYHCSSARSGSRDVGVVKKPRHFLVYRRAAQP